MFNSKHNLKTIEVFLFVFKIDMILGLAY